MAITEKDLQELLAPFGIKPRNGKWYWKDFERAWKIMEENPGITDQDLIRKLQEH